MFIKDGRVYQNVQIEPVEIVEYKDEIYHTVLHYDSGNVYATVYNYLEELQTNYPEPIIFEYEGSQVSTMPIDGVATIDFLTTVAGEHVVKTVNEGIRNGEVIIVV